MTTKFNRTAPWLVCLGLIFALIVTSGAAFAQTIVSGEVSGVVSDPSGAVVPNVTLTLTSKAMGVAQTATTGPSGAFRFPLLQPGQYTLVATAKGFAKMEQIVTVSLGQVTAANLQLKVGAATETVEVAATAPLLDTENANLVTNYNVKQVELYPNPGQDITRYALTSPGSVLSTGAGYGNFTAFGLPGTSNLYTINGNDMNDPYLNLNNSGASNNMLGTNEVQELTVVNNGYTGQYGRQAGTQMDITTKSGSNSFHGNARWDFNSSGFNANEFFNKTAQLEGGVPNQVAHMVSNQWGGSFGGPIKKNKLFFFYDNEGLRYVLPGAGAVPIYVPTQAFQNYVTSNIPAAQAPFYQGMFNLWSGAPGASNAIPLPTSGTNEDGGCGLFTGGGLFGPGAQPCAGTFRSMATSLNTERLQAVRVDWEATSKDRVNFRYWQDRGVQATGTDPINGLFSANSVQPQDVGQVSWTRIFSPTLVNQFIGSGFYYSAKFGPPTLSQAVQLFPYELDFSDGLLTSLGGADAAYPQGRNVTQWQLVDDLSWTRGNHGFKFGMNLRRNDLTNFTLGMGTTGDYIINNMNDFVSGTLANGSYYAQSFPNSPSAPEAFYSLGLYGQDEWRATSKLKLTLALRLERNSNITCRTNCFSEFAGGFNSISHDASTPYNQSINNTLGTAFPSLQRIAWQPRIGFAYQLRSNTVIRGGIGIFNDIYPAWVADRFLTNFPNDPGFNIFNGTLDSPTSAASSSAAAAAAAAASRSLYASGMTLAQLGTPPNYNDLPNQQVLNPRFTEWNLEIEHAVGSKASIRLNYVGNHGSDLFVANRGLNAYFSGSEGSATFGNLPTTQPDPRFNRIIGLSNAGISNYNGLTSVLVLKPVGGFQGTFSYTYSHSLDDVSNGGLLPYSLNNYDYGIGQSSDSARYFLNPQNLAFNYASSDYDFRHNFAFNYVWELPFLHGSSLVDKVAGGWSVAGTFFVRSGEPYSAMWSNLYSTAGIKGYSASPIMAGYVGGAPIPGCGYPFNPDGTPYQCLSSSMFAPEGSQFNFGNLGRNSFRGPGYFNSDFSLLKTFKITEQAGLSFGANAFNVFNHPNFANPYGWVNSSSFGQLQSTVVPSSTPYGNFQGGVFGRVLQLEAKFNF